MNHPDPSSAGSAKIFLGFDPGGDHGFGIALLAGQDIRAATVSTVSDAMAWAITQCGDRVPLAAGVDTLLHWSDGPAGWRPADKVLRTAYPAAQSSIMSPNGLFGSMSVGGMALALRLRQRWPNIMLNETHPKVLVAALGGPRYKDDAPEPAIEWFGGHSGLDMDGIRTGHEFDAALSAWVTREGMAKGWRDLVSRTTHGAAEAIDGCVAFANAIADAIEGRPRSEVLRDRVEPYAGAIGSIMAGSWRRRLRKDIRASGYVAHSLEASLWSVGRTGNFEEAVLVAANLGEDADTTAAITGQLAGALYGATGIPERWLRKLAWEDRISSLAETLFESSIG